MTKALIFLIAFLILVFTGLFLITAYIINKIAEIERDKERNDEPFDITLNE